MYVNNMDPYEEVQHILEVLQRGNPLKGINTNGGIIQIEQEDIKGLEAVLKELSQRGYDVTSIEPLSPSGWAVGIKLIRENKCDKKVPQNDKSKDLDTREDEEFELGD